MKLLTYEDGHGAAYRRQQRYWASGLWGMPWTEAERAFWMGWDRGWYARKPWRRTAQGIAWLALLLALRSMGGRG